MPKYSEHIKEGVVRDILEGRLLLNEVMDKYGILSAITIKKWLREALENTKQIMSQ